MPEAGPSKREREQDEYLSDEEREYKTVKLEDIEDERRVEDKLRVRTVELEAEVDYGYSGPYIKVRSVLLLTDFV